MNVPHRAPRRTATGRSKAFPALQEVLPGLVDDFLDEDS